MKELSVREIAAVKRQFKNSLPALKKIEAINKKIAALEEERIIQEAIIDGGETGIMRLTGGFKSFELITCTYEPQFNEDGTPKMDKDGKYQLKAQVLTYHAPVEDVKDTTEESTSEETNKEEEIKAMQEFETLPFNEY